MARLDFFLLTLTRGKAGKWREGSKDKVLDGLKPRRKGEIEDFSKYFPYCICIVTPLQIKKKISFVSSTSLPFQKIPYTYHGLCSVNSVLVEFNLTFMEITFTEWPLNSRCEFSLNCKQSKMFKLMSLEFVIL